MSHGINSGVHWFSHIVLPPYKQKLQREKALIETRIEEISEWLEQWESIPGNGGRDIEGQRAERETFKKKLKDVNDKIARIWVKPPDDVLAKLNQLYNQWCMLGTEAMKHEMEADNFILFERPEAAKKAREVAADFRSKSDKTLSEFEKLNATWRCPATAWGCRHSAVALGLVKQTANGYEIL